MSTATATQPHSGITPGGYAGEIGALGSVIEIQAFIMREQPGINKRFAERSAQKLKMMRTPKDFYAGLRILGIHTDSTARDAVKNLERPRRTNGHAARG